MTRPLLIDTHVFYWMSAGLPRLQASAVRAIQMAPTVYLSAVSAAELGIKHRLGKLPLPDEIAGGGPDAFARFLERSSLQPLSLDPSAAIRLKDLPRHHDDPFDRLLIAQALDNGLTLVTHDRAFARYQGLDILWT